MNLNFPDHEARFGALRVWGYTGVVHEGDGVRHQNVIVPMGVTPMLTGEQQYLLNESLTRDTRLAGTAVVVSTMTRPFSVPVAEQMGFAPGTGASLFSLSVQGAEPWQFPDRTVFASRLNTIGGCLQAAGITVHQPVKTFTRLLDQLAELKLTPLTGQRSTPRS